MIVENKENIQYNNLVNTYLLFEKYGIKNYIRVDGIVKNIVDLKKHSFFESNEEKAKHYYYNVFQERINVFYLKESIYAKLFSINDYVSAYTSFTDGPFEILLNNVRIENYEILFSETLYGNFKFQIGDLILTEDNLITDFNEDANNELFSFVNNNEIYISLALYNLIFNEYSNFDYYIEKVGFKKYRIKNIPKHIGESISLNIIDYYFDSYNLNYDELIIKGIIFDEYSFGYGGGIIISNSKYEEINRFVSKPNIYMLKSSIENIESFVKECMKLTIRTNYICSNEIDTFEENVKMLKLIFLILSIILLVISFVVLYSMVNRMIRKSKKEFGILKAIGISNQDIIISFKMLIYVIMIILMIFIVPLSSILIYLINNIIVQEIYLGLTIIYYKWWYCLVTAFFIFVIMMISSKLILSKFSKMKAIDLIKSINN